MQMSVPRSPVNRNSGEHPLLGTDDIAYVLGVGPWTPDKAATEEKAEKHHARFRRAHCNALRPKPETQALDRLRPLLCQCRRGRKGARSALREAKAGSLVALSAGRTAGGPRAVSVILAATLPGASSRSAWRATGRVHHLRKVRPDRAHARKDQRVSSLGGQASGVALMSFDKEAFRSYGWEQNQNSPVSPDRACLCLPKRSAAPNEAAARWPRAGARTSLALASLLAAEPGGLRCA